MTSTECTTYQRRQSIMSISQAVLNGEKYQVQKRTVILGISPGNPHYYKIETLERLFDLAGRTSEKVFLFIPDKISEHNYRAVGSKNPERSARIKCNRLRNKCNEAIQSSGLRDVSHSFIRWTEEVESCHEYKKALENIKNLYEVNDDFHNDVRQSTVVALRCLKNGREKGGSDEENKSAEADSNVDLDEGVQYLLKELAFFLAVPNIYKDCNNFVFVYHRPWPVLERFFGGFYDGVEKPSLGFVVFE